jgi:dTDP-4-dehydrorhamnose reductase
MIGVFGNGQVGQHIAEALDLAGVENKIIGREKSDDLPRYRTTDVVFNAETANAGDVRRAIAPFSSIIYTSAYRDVALCESNPRMADRVNHLIPAVIASAKPIVYISTDYVFGKMNERYPRPITGKIGEGEDPESQYFSFGAPSIYGQTKRSGEISVLGKDGIVVRISSPFGKWKSPLRHSFVDNLTWQYGKKLNMPDAQIVSPTYLPAAATTIVNLAATKDADPGVYHAVCEGSASFYVIAKFVNDELGLNQRILPRVDNETDNLRPSYSALQNNKLPQLPFWADALRQHLRGYK